MTEYFIYLDHGTDEPKEYLESSLEFHTGYCSALDSFLCNDKSFSALFKGYSCRETLSSHVIRFITDYHGYKTNTIACGIVGRIESTNLLFNSKGLQFINNVLRKDVDDSLVQDGVALVFEDGERFQPFISLSMLLLKSSYVFNKMYEDSFSNLRLLYTNAIQLRNTQQDLFWSLLPLFINLSTGKDSFDFGREVKCSGIATYSRRLSLIEDKYLVASYSFCKFLGINPYTLIIDINMGTSIGGMMDYRKIDKKDDDMMKKFFGVE